ncbi:MAG: oligosaccharide flippase family protein [Myxococcota bacterium]
MSALRADTLANLAAFGVMAVSGVTLNLLVVALSGQAALGVFNQVYAVYVVTSMLAVFGVHDAVHRETAAHPGDVARQRASLSSGLAVAAGTGALGALALLALAEPIGWLAGSPEVGRGLTLLAPALLPFAINKVLMASLSGQTRLQAFAAVQIVRVLTLLGVVVGLAAADWAAGWLALGFGAAELVILPVLLGLLRPAPGLASREHARAHLAFGVRALPHGFIAESFLRVDVLMLAPFVGDAAIGMYSLAAMFAEGLVQIGGTVRSVMAPRLVPQLGPDAERAERARLLRQAMAMGLGAFVVVAGGLAVGFPALGWGLDPSLVAGAHEVLLVLVVGLAVNAAFLPLDQLLLWAGRPAQQSLMMGLNLTLNVVLNLALIPSLGVAGAAMATAMAWSLSAVVLNVAAWRWLGFRGGIPGEAFYSM